MNPKPMSIDQAVVLIGQRDAGFPVPKGSPPKKILGLTVLERLILSAYQVGVRDFLLVGSDGFHGDGHLPSPEKDKRFRKEGLHVEQVPLADLPDLVRQGKVKNRFWLFDGDVVFDPAILADAGQDDSSPLGSVGPGIQICDREMFPRLVEALLKHGFAPPGPPCQVESRGAFPSEALDDKGKFCLKVVSRKDAKRAIRYILSTGRRPEDGFMARVFIRPVSLMMTKHLLKLNMTPNMMTIISLAFGGLSVWLIGRGDPRSAVLAGCAFQFASILDHCDGANARITFRISKLGSAADLIGDILVYVFFFLSLPLGLYRVDRQTIWLILGLVVFLSMILYYFKIFRIALSAGAGSISLTSASLYSFASKTEGKSDRQNVRGKLERLTSRVTFIFRREFFPTAVLLILIFAGTKALMVMVSILYPLQGVYIMVQAKKRLST